MQKVSRDAIIEAEAKELSGTTVEMARAHLVLYPTDERVWYELGCALGELSRFAEAEEALDQALRHGREAFRKFVYIQRGHMSQRKGNYAIAERWFSKAISLDPQASYTHVFRAVVIGKRGDLKLAEQRYREALVVCRDDLDEVYANLGAILIAQERYEEAAQCFEHALELDPDYEFAQIRLKDARQAINLRQSKHE